MTPWLASFTRRWHANPDLCHTVDPVGYHGGRMGILALALWRKPGSVPSRELLAACLAHDLGESVTGDIPWGAKQDDTLRIAATHLEENAIRSMGMAFDLSADDARRLKYLDRLDAYLWAKHHAPHVLAQADWLVARGYLIAESKALGAEVVL